MITPAVKTTQRCVLRGVHRFLLAVASAVAVALAAAPCAGETLCERQNIPLAAPLTIEGVEAWIRPADLRQGSLDVLLSVNSLDDSWTVAKGDVCLIAGSEKWRIKSPLFKDGAANTGPLESGKALHLTFQLPAAIAPGQKVGLLITGGIYAWGGGKNHDQFSLTLWRGLRARPLASMDAAGRVASVDASASTGDIARYEYRVNRGGGFVSARPTWRGRVPPDGLFAGELIVHARNGETDSAPFSARHVQPAPPLPKELLTGVCFYPEEELAEPELARLEAAGKNEWGAPYRRERHPPDAYLQKALAEELGNLFVIWPEVQKTAQWGETGEAKWIADLSRKSIYYMTIYQNAGRDAARRFAAAGGARFFLGNNVGEYASYLYQGAGSAKACGVPQEGDLEQCRDWFVNSYIAKGARDYHRSYDLVFSTSGAGLSAYELEGGMDVILGELYAVGAANLAYATAEMRGAARQWKPEYWGGWLAHEWQTTSIPYQSEEKFLSLRAGLYQQYLMGSSMIVLESGSQSTQAGAYTNDSGKINQGFSAQAPVRYREEMRNFHRYVRTHPRAAGTPETRLALALGHCDSFVGYYIDGLPQWAQYEQAKTNPNWLYGAPERAWLAAQRVVFPTPAGAAGPRANIWLGGSPFGQTDICAVDRLTTAGDLQRYQGLAYAGWNSMTADICAVLAQYVSQGGRLLLCLPHLSTRLDREYRHYAAGDLIGNGDLSALAPVKIFGAKSITVPPTFAGMDMNAPEPSVLAALKGERVADAALGPGAEILCGTPEAPVVVRYRKGRGEVILLLTWEYPGKPSLAGLYEHLLAEFAASLCGAVFVSEVGETVPRRGPHTSFIAHATYPDTVYLLNMDTQSPHAFALHQRGKALPMTLQPAEFREIKNSATER